MMELYVIRKLCTLCNTCMCWIYVFSNSIICLKYRNYIYMWRCCFFRSTCRFCVVISFFSPCHNGQWPPTSKDFLSQIVSITFIFPILIIEKEPVFPCWMFSAKQGNFWYHYYNVFGMTRSLTGVWTRTRSPHSTTRLSRRRLWRRQT